MTDSGTPPTATAPTSGVRTVDLNNDDPGIVYTGSWSRSTGRGLGDYQDDVQYTETNDDSFSYSFVGNGVDYVTEKDPSQGQVDIYIDGALKRPSTPMPTGAPRSRSCTASRTCRTAATRSAG